MDFHQSLGIELLIDSISTLDLAHVGVGLRVGDGVKGLPVVGVVAAFQPAGHIAHARVVGGQGHLHGAVLVQPQWMLSPGSQMSPLSSSVG